MYCYHCMNEIKQGSFCTCCMKENQDLSEPHHLKPGTILHGKYLIGNKIGQGGFGITYIGLDTTLDLCVAIKEYFPNGRVSRNHEVANDITVTNAKNADFFKQGKNKFLLEAKSIAKFSKEKGVVDVRDYFEENGTAYIIMEYLGERNLIDYVVRNGNMNATELILLMKPIMEALAKMHNQGIIHRDISPDNIMYLEDGTLKLMDFGAARYFLNQDNNNMSVVLKLGYAPEEQHRKNGKQGPWTDVYGLCATLYRCITGIVPEDALDRLHADNLKKPSELGIDIPQKVEAVLMYGLAVHVEKRCKSMEELLDLLDRALSPEETVPMSFARKGAERAYQTLAVEDENYTKAADADMRDGFSESYTTDEEKPKKKLLVVMATFLVVCLLAATCINIFTTRLPQNDKKTEKEQEDKETKKKVKEDVEKQEIEVKDKKEEKREAAEEEITQETPQETSKPQTVLTQEQKIEYIRNIYYTTQENVPNLRKDGISGLYWRYLDANNRFHKITLYPNNSEFPDIPNASDYVVDYYYDITGQVEELVFAFVVNHATGEEHRFYQYDKELIRYINPSKTVLDNPQNISGMTEYRLYDNGNMEVLRAYGH